MPTAFGGYSGEKLEVLGETAIRRRHRFKDAHRQIERRANRYQVFDASR